MVWVCEFTKDKKFIESKKGSLVLLTNKESSSAQTIEQTISQNNENLALQTVSSSGSLSIVNNQKNKSAGLTVIHVINGVEIPKEKMAELAIRSPVIDRLIASVNNKTRRNN